MIIAASGGRRTVLRLNSNNFLFWCEVDFFLLKKRKNISSDSVSKMKENFKTSEKTFALFANYCHDDVQFMLQKFKSNEVEI